MSVQHWLSEEECTVSHFIEAGEDAGKPCRLCLSCMEMLRPSQFDDLCEPEAAAARVEEQFQKFEEKLNAISSRRFV